MAKEKFERNKYPITKITGDVKCLNRLELRDILVSSITITSSLICPDVYTKISYNIDNFEERSFFISDLISIDKGKYEIIENNDGTAHVVKHYLSNNRETINGPYIPINSGRNGLLFWHKSDENEWNAITVFNQSNKKQLQIHESNLQALPRSINLTKKFTSDYDINTGSLTFNELNDIVTNSLIRTESLSNPNTIYKTFLNSDKTFQVITSINGRFDNVSTGLYKVVDKDGIGYIKLDYNDDITPSKDPDSIYNLNNPYSLLKTHSLFSGPYRVLNDNNYSKVLLLNIQNNKVLILTIFKQK
jgi:hypothetical protein